MRKPELWLSLDLSTACGTLAFHEWNEGQNPVLLLEKVVGEGFDHSERLLDTLIHALDSLDKRLEDVSRFITVSGPGSFTGMRIAYSALKAFLLAHPAKLESVGAAEARVLGWLAESGRKASPISVVSRVSSSKLSVSSFNLLADGTVECFGEEIATEWKPRAGVVLGEYGEAFALTARHLATALPRAKSRTTHESFADSITAPPRYVGSQF